MVIVLSFCQNKNIIALVSSFRVLGTPNEEVWPRVSKLKYWSSEFPKFRPKNLGDLVPNLHECGVDLLSVRSSPFLKALLFYSLV